MKNKFIFGLLLLNGSFFPSFSSQKESVKCSLDKGRKWRTLGKDIFPCADGVVLIAVIDRSTPIRIEKDNQSLCIVHTNGEIAYCDQKDEHQGQAISK